MRGRRIGEEKVIEILRLHAARAKTADVCRQHGISASTLYAWKAKYGGMTVPDGRRLRTLEDENRRLKKLLAGAVLDNAVLKDLASGKFQGLPRGVGPWTTRCGSTA